MKNAILGFVLIFACVNYVGLASIREMKETPRLKISIGSQVFYANIQANESVSALVKQLPFTLSMVELNGNENAIETLTRVMLLKSRLEEEMASTFGKRSQKANLLLQRLFEKPIVHVK